MQRVTDAQILAAVWRQMVKATAKGAIQRYLSGRIGINSDDLRCYGQDLRLIRRADLGLPLSTAYLRRRIVALVDSGQLQWVVGGCTFWINESRTLELWRRATQWWADKGVPSGFDEGKRGMRTTALDNFEELAAELEALLLAEFGEHQDAGNGQTIDEPA